LIAAFIHDLERLAGLLDGGVTDAVYAEVVGHGEVWSARLMAAVLNQLGMEAAWLDAREFCARNAARSRRWMKDYLTHCCSSCWRSIRTNVWW
jgi:aspartokinase/homoserine dehydrogenase 2